MAKRPDIVIPPEDVSPVIPFSDDIEYFRFDDPFAFTATGCKISSTLQGSVWTRGELCKMLKVKTIPPFGVFVPIGEDEYMAGKAGE